MPRISYKTKGASQPKGKPRIYFSCHPDDFDNCFEKICGDIFKTQDCVIYYTEDMSEGIDDKDIVIGQNNLFVIPVTFRLLTTANRAIDDDLPYALKERMPVLPIMMENGLDALYSRQDRFGELQYLNAFSNDSTEISYDEKLKHFLECVLISEELTKRVRAAFDAYIFLSYRKKDRKYANELMHLIHSHPECRDIAIWYDEFLTPGESFKENIDKILSTSKLFALLVTPNLLEEPDGVPNYVMGEEYPAAVKAGIDILPTEMVKTDIDALKQKYIGIPHCVNPHDSALLKTTLLDSIFKVVRIANDDDPVHNFLIGLAYLEGIDVEVNRDRGINLITSAADCDVPEAMEKLYHMYYTGSGVAFNSDEARKWAERLSNYYLCKYGEKDPRTLKWINNLTVIICEFGDPLEAVEACIRSYQLHKKVFGKTDVRSLGALNNLASAYGKNCNYKRMVMLCEEVYELRCTVLGDKHEDTLTSLSNLAYAYGKIGNHKRELDLQERAYVLRCEILGDEHMDTLKSLNNLASIYGSLGYYQKSLELNKRAYNQLCNACGNDHPSTLTSLGNLALAYGRTGDIQSQLGLYEEKYKLSQLVLGEDHPNTLIALNGIAVSYEEMGQYEKALELQDKVYNRRCKLLGKAHPHTLNSLSNLSSIYTKLKQWEKALDISREIYSLRRTSLGTEHPSTLRTMNNIAYINGVLGNWCEAEDYSKRAYILLCKILGEDHPDTIAAMSNLGYVYDKLGKCFERITLLEKEFDIRCKVMGLNHPNTLRTKQMLSELRKSTVICGNNRGKKLCQHCGGEFTGILRKRCSKCGKPKDY